MTARRREGITKWEMLAALRRYPDHAIFQGSCTGSIHVLVDWQKVGSIEPKPIAIAAIPQEANGR